jgi:hypothetical protein
MSDCFPVAEGALDLPEICAQNTQSYQSPSRSAIRTVLTINAALNYKLILLFSSF